MLRSSIWISLSTLAVLLLYEPSHATTVTVEFSGQVTSVANDLNAAPGVPIAGDLVTGSLSFESTIQDLALEDPNQGLYDAVIWYGVDIGTLSWSAQNGQIEILNNHDSVGGHDRYEAESTAAIDGATGPSFGEFTLRSIVLTLRDHDGEALTSDSLITVPLNLDDFESAVLSLIYNGPQPGHTRTISIHFHSLSLANLVEAVIDIKPGSYPNSVNLGSNGVIPVAVLSSAGFDATEVAPETITLAGAGVAVRGKGNKYLSHYEDANDDGIGDLVCQVETVNLDPDAFQNGCACLTGETIDGRLIVGWDEIRVVPLD